MKWSQTCKSCLFCDRGADPYLCRKDNPKPEMFLDKAALRAVWPTVKDDDWCTQWKQRSGVSDFIHVCIIDLKTGNQVDEISGPVPEPGQMICYRLPRMELEIRLNWIIPPEKEDEAKKEMPPV